MIYVGLIILVNLLFYIRTLKFPGICDDIPIFNRKDMPIPKGWWMFFWYHLHGRKYVSWKLAHCQTLTVHIINCVLIYVVFGMNYYSLIAALLFSVNPINNQCSIWLSGKCYSMNTTFSLLMWWFPLASPLIYVYATYFCGASIILFPVMFVFTKFWWLIVLISLGFYREASRIFCKDANSKFKMESNKELLSKKPRKLIMVCKTLGYYFINAIFCLRIGFYHKYMFLHGINKIANKESYRIDKYFFVGLGVIALTLYTMHIGLLWFCITLAMWLNFISFNQTLSNRYVYLPNVGLTLYISSLLINYPVIAVVLFTYYATRLIQFRIFYQSEYWAIEHSCMEQPDFFYPWQNRAVHCWQNGNFHGALANMVKADQLRPNDWKISYNMCQIYVILGNMGAAREWYGKASKCMIDGREEAIGRLMDKLGKWLEQIEKCAKENNNSVQLDIKNFDMQR